MTRPRILVVDDNAVIVNLLGVMLKALGYTVVGSAPSGEGAIRRVIETDPDLILMDITLEGGIDGIETAIAIHSVFHIPIVFLTGSMDSDTIQRAKAAEPFGYITKPFNQNEIYSTIEIAFNNYELSAVKKSWKNRDLRVIMHAEKAILITDAAGRILFMNPFAEFLTDWDASRAFLQPIWDVVVMRDRSGMSTKEFMEKIRNESINYRVERVGTLSSQNGKQRTAKIRSIAYKNRHGELVSLLISMDQIFSGT
ncbi:MAG: response regulator [Methanoculleaceae archaeon]